MCGICGFVRPGGVNVDSARAIGLSMALRMKQRGPDSDGCWVDGDAGVTLAHRRLAIVELSQAGHQPMTSPSGRYEIVLNGEIYNHLDLRKHLANSGHHTDWRGGSDTETLSACIDHIGLAATVKLSVGMFAFALWDRQKRRLSLVRDRLGEKPLYYGWNSGVFFFASDLSALGAHPDFRPEISQTALSGFLKYSYVPQDQSVYSGISKLPPGTVVELDLGERDAASTGPASYWSLKEVASSGVASASSDDHSAEALEQALLDAVSGQMSADVPVGAFLSGGVDSSLIAALMQRVSDRRISTFTIGFADKGYDESEHAARVAAHLGTNHHELILEPKDVIAAIPAMSQAYSEPFADSSQIPTYLVSKFAREQVKVALSGDGADELFAGYNRYLNGWNVWQKTSRAPAMARTLAASLIRARSTAQWDGLFAAAYRMRGRTPVRTPGVKMHKISRILGAEQPQDYYDTVTMTGSPSPFLISSDANSPSTVERANLFSSLGAVNAMMLLDAQNYLPDDILVKVDRASMACSLETRAPFLDHRVVELAWRIPLSQKLGSGEGKHVLRNILYKHVPRELIDRPKMGFGIPVGSWLRTELRDWVESLINEDALISAGLLDPASVRAIWNNYLDGTESNESQLWNIIMLQAWHSTWVRDRAPG